MKEPGRKVTREEFYAHINQQTITEVGPYDDDCQSLLFRFADGSEAVEDHNRFRGAEYWLDFKWNREWATQPA